MDHSLQSSDPTKREPRVAVLIPCLNEEETIGKVVRDFKLQLPEGMIFVFDNNSTDRTAEEATAAGAIVSKELRRGKGFVVQTMFQCVEADVYVMVDGDDTYPVEKVQDLLQPILDKQTDMVVGSRTTSESDFYFLNRIGNMLNQ